MNGANITEILERAGISTEELLKQLVAVQPDLVSGVARQAAIRKVGDDVARRICEALTDADLSWETPFLGENAVLAFNVIIKPDGTPTVKFTQHVEISADGESQPEPKPESEPETEPESAPTTEWGKLAMALGFPKGARKYSSQFRRTVASRLGLEEEPDLAKAITLAKQMLQAKQAAGV